MDWDTLAKQAEAAFGAVPAGEYSMTITSSEAVKASTGKPMLKVKMRIDGGPHNGRLVFNNFVITVDNPNAMGFFFRHMKGFGLDADFFSRNPEMNEVADALMGRSALVTLGIRQYQGADQNEVKAIKPATGGIAGMGSPAGLPSPGGLPAATSLPTPGTPAGLPAATALPGAASVTSATSEADQAAESDPKLVETSVPESAAPRHPDTTATDAPEEPF